MPVLVGCVVLRVREARSRTISGGFGVGETPLPIPNRAVKPHSADGTWPSRAWESRSPPVLPARAARWAARRVSEPIRVEAGQSRQRQERGQDEHGPCRAAADRRGSEAGGERGGRHSQDREV